MDGKFQVLTDTSAGKRRNVKHPVARWQNVLIAMLLVIMLGTTSQITIAQAAPPNKVSVSYWMEAGPAGARRTICVGDTIKLRVRVFKQVEDFEADLGPLKRPLLQSKITAELFGNNGTISPSTATTSATSDVVGSAIFTFTAQKTGEAEVLFTTDVSGIEVLGISVGGRQMQKRVKLTVENCTYRLTATSRWRVPGDAHITLFADIDSGGLVQDSNGNINGIVAVKWTALTEQVGDCKAKLSPESEAQIEGIYSRDEKLIRFYMIYLPANFADMVSCKEAGGSRPITIAPNPVEVVLPSIGGTQGYGHLLIGPEPSWGRINVIVTRIKGQ